MQEELFREHERANLVSPEAWSMAGTFLSLVTVENSSSTAWAYLIHHAALFQSSTCSRKMTGRISQMWFSQGLLLQLKLISTQSKISSRHFEMNLAFFPSTPSSRPPLWQSARETRVYNYWWADHWSLGDGHSLSHGKPSSATGAEEHEINLHQSSPVTGMS